MKIDLLGRKWLDIVFEGRNKSYGAYDLRKKNASTNMKALAIGAVVFAIAVATPKIAEFISNVTSSEDEGLHDRITAVKLPPKEEVKPKEDLKPPPPPKPREDVVKFVKPVVAKTEDVTEEPPKNEEIKDKDLGKENIKGDPNAALPDGGPIGDGPPAKNEVVEDDTVYPSAGLEVQPEYPGGINKFREFIGKNFEAPSDEGFPGGKVLVQFTVEKDGSLSNIQVLKDIGFGTKAEAIRVLKTSKVKWTPAEQNGRKVRSSYQLPIVLQAPSE